MINVAKEALREAVFPSPAEKQQHDYTELMARISALEGVDHEYEIFRVIEGGTAGRISLPDGVSIRLDQYPGAADCLVTGGAGGRPSDSIVLTAGGDHVVGTLDADGNYSLSGTPAEYPVFLVFQIHCKGKSVSKITLDERA